MNIKFQGLIPVFLNCFILNCGKSRNLFKRHIGILNHLVHSFMKKTVLSLAMLSAILLVGCENYTYTLNEQPVFTPPSLFTDYQVSDRGLANCLNQAIQDQKAIKAQDLTLLNCSSAGIANLQGLELFTGLTHVNLGDNNLREIQPLLYLPQLDTVVLTGNNQLRCEDAKLLAKQVSGEIRLPDHCSQ